MSTGAITPSIDVAQLVLYAFWIFFAGLIYYLHRENKREGYPLESDRSPHVKVQGFPAIPEPKSFKLADGRTVHAPHDRDSLRAVLAATPHGHFPGAPLQPSGNPFVDNVGPGSWTARSDVPDVTIDGQPRIVPLRAVDGWGVADGDPDPRGMNVLGADGASGGTVRDLWVDRSEQVFRYLEVELAAPDGRRVLLPMNFAKVGDRHVTVRSILGGQFAGVPGTKQPEQLTLLEEEKIMAYYGARHALRDAGPGGAAAVKTGEHEFEAVHGLPEALPPGETLLWQGAPDWRVLAVDALHLRKVAIYFGVLLIWRGASASADGASPLAALVAAAGLLPLALLALALLATIAWLIARTSVYTLTDKRVVMRVGVVLCVTFNLPFSTIESAGLRMKRDGHGDITLALAGSDRIAWLHLWPHARPWRLRRTEPMLRALPHAQRVATLLADALARSAGTTAAAVPPATPATRPVPGTVAIA